MFGYASTRRRFFLGDQIHAKSINKQIKGNNTQIFTILSRGSGIGEGDGCEATLTSSVKNGFVLNLLEKKSYCLPLKSVCVGWEGWGGGAMSQNSISLMLI